MTESADAGDHVRASAAEDKTYRNALRQAVMLPEKDEVSTTHARAERHKVLRIAEGEGSAAVERTEARSEQSWEKVKRNQLNTPRYEYSDVYTHGD